MEPQTLAGRLGTTAHLSALLMKARRLGLSTPMELERLAVSRGLRYYDKLLGLQPAGQSLPQPDVLPHPTRFVAMAGITRNGVGTLKQSIRPRTTLVS